MLKRKMKDNGYRIRLAYNLRWIDRERILYKERNVWSRISLDSKLGVFVI